MNFFLRFCGSFLTAFSVLEKFCGYSLAVSANINLSEVFQYFRNLEPLVLLRLIERNIVKTKFLVLFVQFISVPVANKVFSPFSACTKAFFSKDPFSNATSVGKCSNFCLSLYYLNIALFSP